MNDTIRRVTKINVTDHRKVAKSDLAGNVIHQTVEVIERSQ
jgi:hypothetical protein